MSDQLSKSVADLRQNKHRLPSWPQNAANDLLRSLDRWGSLSDKQWAFLQSLARQSVQPDPTQRCGGASKAGAAPTAKPAEKPRTYTTLLELFARADVGGLKKPKLFFVTDAGHKITIFKRERGDYAGNLVVTERLRAGSARKAQWYGSIQKGNGNWFAYDMRTDDAREVQADVERKLDRVNADPAKEARLHGHLHGNCCFCGLTLKTNESISAGYGPICASKYGMPWGDTLPAQERLKEIKADALDVGNKAESELAQKQALAMVEEQERLMFERDSDGL